MHLLHTCGLLAIVIISLISISSLQAKSLGPDCSMRDFRGCCLNPRMMTTTCARTTKKESKRVSNSTEELNGGC